MSVVGNFQYQNHDRGGVPVHPGHAVQPRHYAGEEEINDEATEMSQAETLAHREQGVTELARQLTRQSTRMPENPFNYQEGSDLDPFAANFDARKYTRALAKLSQGAGVGRLSGVSYKNLSVHGFGTDAGESSAEVDALR